MKLPLSKRLKKQVHREIALAQDLLVRELYLVFPQAIIHGGTAIWRCYQGQRFSEDLDVFILRDLKKIHRFYTHLEKAGFTVERKKIGGNSIYSTLRFHRATVRFEAVFKHENTMLGMYETVEGNFVPVYTFTPEGFIRDKVKAYLNRRKIRDLYDIFFLLPKVKDKSRIQEALQKLFQHYQPPFDEKELAAFILEGVAPSAQKMKEFIEIYGISKT